MNDVNSDKAAQGAGDGVTPSPRLEIDYDLYAEMLKDSDMTDAQKREFLGALWQVIINFVDLGFGVHPLQSVHKGDEKVSKELEDAIADMVSSSQSTQPTFKRVARQTKASVRER